MLIDWRRLNILCIMFNGMAFFILTMFAQLYMRVVILFTCGKQLHVCGISQREEL